MKVITHLDLFSGIGGMSLASEIAGILTVGFCEWADYPTKVLEKHWPDVPKWRDIRTLTRESFYERTGLRTVDVVSGGFPCQPFSVAGKRRGKEDDRYLWPEMLRVIQEIRPTWVVGENVAGIVKMALDTVLFDLESIGYTCQAFIIPACAIDTPHRRDRVCIVGRSRGQGNLLCTDTQGTQHTDIQKGERTVQEQPQFIGLCSDVSNVHNGGGALRRDGELSTVKVFGGIRSDYGGGTPEYGCWERRTVESRMGRVVDGFPDWLDRVINGVFADEPNIPRIASGVKDRVNRLKCLGNAVVPAQFYPIFKAIAEIENEQQAD